MCGENGVNGCRVMVLMVVLTVVVVALMVLVVVVKRPHRLLGPPDFPFRGHQESHP